MLFKQVVGQEEAKHGLLKMWKSNLFPHALMILGAEGTGGLPIALALAQYIFCENKQENDACGQCAGCSKASKLEHADLHLTFPVIRYKPSPHPVLSVDYIKEFKEFFKQTPYGTTYDWLQFINAENKQGSISVDECREIIRNLNLKSYEGGKKIQIIWRPENFSGDGKTGNILLKLIEEPPQDTLLILVAENIEDILPTIRSRTQLVKLVPVSTKDLSKALVDRLVAEPARAEQIAHISMGSYTEALRLARSTDNDLYPTVSKLFKALLKSNLGGPDIASFVEDMSKQGREQQKNLLYYIIHLLENAIRAIYRKDIAIPLPEKEAQFVKYIASPAANLSFEQLTYMVKIVSDTSFYIERNAHGKTQLLAMAIQLSYIIRKIEMPVI